MFLMWGIYSPLPSLLGIPTHIEWGVLLRQRLQYFPSAALSIGLLCIAHGISSTDSNEVTPQPMAASKPTVPECSGFSTISRLIGSPDKSGIGFKVSQPHIGNYPRAFAKRAWRAEKESNPHFMVRSHVFFPLDYRRIWWTDGESNPDSLLARQECQPLSLSAHITRPVVCCSRAFTIFATDPYGGPGWIRTNNVRDFLSIAISCCCTGLFLSLYIYNTKNF